MVRLPKRQPFKPPFDGPDTSMGRPIGRWVVTVEGRDHEIVPYRDGLFLDGQWFEWPGLETTVDAILGAY